MNDIQEFIFNNYIYDNDDLDMPENKIEKYFSICHYILNTAKEETSYKNHYFDDCNFISWIKGIPSCFDVLEILEDQGRYLAETFENVTIDSYVTDVLESIYEELLKAEEMYNFLKYNELKLIKE